MTTLNSLPGIAHQPLTQEEVSKINAYWRAANYLSVGQIYLYRNPLLREPLKLAHIKPRLLGHFGTCLLYTSPSPRDTERSRMPSSA